MTEANTMRVRWEPYDEGDESDGDIVCGEEGCSDYRVIAQAVDRAMGEMIVNDVVAHDGLEAEVRRLRKVNEKALAALRFAQSFRAISPGSALAQSIGDAIRLAEKGVNDGGQ